MSSDTVKESVSAATEPDVTTQPMHVVLLFVLKIEMQINLFNFF